MLLACSVSLQAQKIKYETSFEKAKALAVQEKKPLAVLVTVQSPSYPKNYTGGLDDRRVAEKFNSSFVCYRVDMADTANAGKIIRAYNVSQYPSFIFLDAKGGLLFADIAPLPCPEPLLEIADRAIAASKEKSMADYDREYAAGSCSTTFLKEYIGKRQRARITDNADLVEKYVKGLSVADFSKYSEVLFILKAGPVVYGNAYTLAYMNRPLVDSIYKVEPSAVRIAINNTIVENTLSRAVAAKNEQLANSAAGYSERCWGKNHREEGNKNWNAVMMEYYIGVKDTVSYLQKASYFYNDYYMNISVDSLKKKDSINLAARNKAAASRTKLSDTTVNRTETYSYTSFKDSYATILNNAAWRFYLMAGDKTDYLLKAMLWSRRSIEVTPKASFYDTYAHILYKLKLFDEAESMERKAVELGKAEKFDVKVYQEEYGKIKSRSL